MDQTGVLLVVIARCFSVAANHRADVDTGAYVPHLTIRIGRCTEKCPPSRELFAVGEIGIYLLEIGLCEVDELILEEVIHRCG